MARHMKVVNVGKGKIPMLGPALEMVPETMFFKEDGTKDDKPSLAFSLRAPHIAMSIFGQMSLDTLRESLEEVGYTITKI